MVVINWEDAIPGATHHFDDGGSEWWFKQNPHSPGEFYCSVGQGWSHRCYKIGYLSGVLMDRKGRSQRVAFGKLEPVLEQEPPQPLAQPQLAEQPVPKKKVGWW